MEYHPFLAKQFPVPWAELTPEQAKIDIEYAMKLAEDNINAICNLTDDQITYDSVFKAYDQSDIELNQGFGYLSHLNSVHDNEALRAVYKELNPKVTELYTKFDLNPKLWAVVKKAAEKLQNADLSPVQKRYIEYTVVGFKLSGADLNETQKKEFAEISIEMSKLTEQYNTNVLDSTNAFELYVKDKSELEGLPETALTQASEAAEKKGHQGEFLFTLHFPSISPVLKYAKNDELRKKMWEGRNAIGHSGNFDNETLVGQILDLRNRKAQILGFKSFADLILTRRMAQNGDTALHFVDDLHQKCREQFFSEMEDLRKYKASKVQDENTVLLPWETHYYREMMRKEQYDFDEELLRPYFSVDSVMKGVFSITSILYGIDVIERETYYRASASEPIQEGKVEVWHPDVKYFEVFEKDTNEQLGGFYADWFPREDKRGGAWKSTLYSLYNSNPKNLAVIAGNIQKPTANKPALLNHYEVETIFHEFGHLCHSMVTKASIITFSGTCVPRDFVELPSQLLENWTWERDALNIFAKHIETGEIIPQDIFDKMIKAKNFMSAVFMMAQLSYGKIDLEIHHHYEKYKGKSVQEIDDDVLVDYRVKYPVPIASILFEFSHLFSHETGYAAAYYSYLWSEVLDADAFTRFAKEGILNEKVGHEFRDKVLIWGNEKPVDELFRDFMGRDPDPQALLIRKGIKS